ncbi:MAG: DUF418 domain-containing protein [Salinivirgaceae bacterium]|jgi:uncharacterized protein|nr:DUF418 domain-containing protein [Salinivirgaceae bacterium]
MKNNNRIVIVDALRGLALLLIVFIHYIEHFELFARPEVRWFFSEATDGKVFESIIFLVGGKAYSIFALMFGFSFFIQLNRSEQRGVDFRGKFAWRLTILLIMGFFHSLIYKGDILHIYAIMGFLLIPLYSLKIKHLIIVGSLFLLQVPSIIQIIQAFTNPNYSFNPTFGWGFWGEIDTLYSTGSFWDVVKFNFWQGRTSVWGWTFYTGRYLQLFGLFIAGVVIGKSRFFENLDQHKGLIKKVLIISPLVVAVLLTSRKMVFGADLSELQKQMTGGLLHMWSNIAFTLFYVSGLISLHMKFKSSRLINSLAVYGKMSLSNYVFQAVFGVIFFYNFGFGMYKYMGSTWSLIMGILFFILQVEISKYWISRYYYGPLEWLWRAITMFDFTIKLKRLERLSMSTPLIKINKRA